MAMVRTRDGRKGGILKGMEKLSGMVLKFANSAGGAAFFPFLWKIVFYCAVDRAINM